MDDLLAAVSPSLVLPASWRSVVAHSSSRHKKRRGEEGKQRALAAAVDAALSRTELLPRARSRAVRPALLPPLPRFVQGRPGAAHARAAALLLRHAAASGDARLLHRLLTAVVEQTNVLPLVVPELVTWMAAWAHGVPSRRGTLVRFLRTLRRSVNRVYAPQIRPMLTRALLGDSKETLMNELQAWLADNGNDVDLLVLAAETASEAVDARAGLDDGGGGGEEEERALQIVTLARAAVAQLGDVEVNMNEERLAVKHARLLVRTGQSIEALAVLREATKEDGGRLAADPLALDTLLDMLGQWGGNGKRVRKEQVTVARRLLAIDPVAPRALGIVDARREDASLTRLGGIALNAVAHAPTDAGHWVRFAYVLERRVERDGAASVEAEPWWEDLFFRPAELPLLDADVRALRVQCARLLYGKKHAFVRASRKMAARE